MLVSLTGEETGSVSVSTSPRPCPPSSQDDCLSTGSVFWKEKTQKHERPSRWTTCQLPPQWNMISCQYWHTRLQSDRSSWQTCNQMTFWLNQATRKLKSDLKATGQHVCASGALTWTILVQQIEQTEISVCEREMVYFWVRDSKMSTAGAQWKI